MIDTDRFVEKAEQETGQKVADHGEARCRIGDDFLGKRGLLCATAEGLAFVEDNVLEPGMVTVVPAADVAKTELRSGIVEAELELRTDDELYTFALDPDLAERLVRAGGLSLSGDETPGPGARPEAALDIAKPPPALDPLPAMEDEAPAIETATQDRATALELDGGDDDELDEDDEPYEDDDEPYEDDDEPYEDDDEEGDELEASLEPEPAPASTTSQGGGRALSYLVVMVTVGVVVWYVGAKDESEPVQPPQPQVAKTAQGPEPLPIRLPRPSVKLPQLPPALPSGLPGDADGGVVFDPVRAAQLHDQVRELVQSGKHREAIPLAQEAVALDPTEAQSYMLLAEAYRAIGRKDLTQKTYDECVAQASPLGARKWCPHGSQPSAPPP